MTITKTEVCVRYAETDQMGVTHHAVYPIWFELARTDFIKVIGITYSEMEEMGILLPVAELSVKYRMPTKYEDRLTIETNIERITPARIVFAYRLYRSDDPEKTILAEGSSTHAWVDQSMRPMNMKKSYPELYGQIAQLM